MVLSLFAATANVVGGQIAAATGPVQFLVGAGVTLAGAGGVLWLAVSPVRPASEDSVEASGVAGD